MLDPQGVSKGSGFVAFSTPEEASKAVSFNCLIHKIIQIYLLLFYASCIH